MIKFNIYPQKGDKRYYRVVVFNQKLEMRQYAQMFSHYENCEAVTFSYLAHRVNKAGKTTQLNRIGDILFYKNSFGAGIVAHEMTHAVNHWFKNNKISFKLDKINKDWGQHDEQHAWMVGYLTNQFWKKYTGKVNIHKEKY